MGDVTEREQRPVRVLLVDDDEVLGRALKRLFDRRGMAVTVSESIDRAMALLADPVVPFDVVLADIAFGDATDRSGLKFIRHVRTATNARPIGYTGLDSPELMAQCLDAGALDCFFKLSLPTDEMLERIHALVAARQVESFADHRLKGVSPAIRDVRILVERYARRSEPVLIQGESGTGKDVIATLLHERSLRSGRLVVVAAGGSVPSTFEASLVGHQKGAFTGAERAVRGLFDEARGGTLLFDEIGDLPLELQPRLLRVIENRSFRPLGAAAEVAFDGRVVAATNANLEALVAAGRFRLDLYQRLNVLRIDVPPLSARPVDIPILARAFASEYGLRLSADAAYWLRGQRFRGNVRELRNVIARLAATGDRADVEDVKVALLPTAGPNASPPRDALDALSSARRALIHEALARAQGNESAAARSLGMTRGRLRRFLGKSS